MEWRDRIIAYDKATPSKLIANARNYRKHPVAQRRALRAAIGEVGYVQPVVVNRRTGNIVDGHLRVELAKEDGIAAIPVIYIDVTEQEEMKLLSTIDPISNMAVIDHQIFDDLLKQVASTDQMLNDMWDAMKRDAPKAKDIAAGPVSEAAETVGWERDSTRYWAEPEFGEKYIANSVRTISMYIQHDDYVVLIQKLDALLPAYDCKSYQELFIQLAEKAYAEANH